MKNHEIAKILEEVAIYLEMEDEIVFKVRAYENAAVSLASLAEDVEEVYKKGGIGALQEIPGIGKGLAEKIEEYLKTGKIQFYEDLKKKVPVDVSSLKRIESLGPKKIKVLYKKLKIKNVEDLEKAAKAGKIRVLEGFGKKTEQNILKGIEFMKKSRGRFTIFEVESVVREIERQLKPVKGIEKLIVAGSYRRRKETIGDIDILVVSKNPGIVMDAFTSMKNVAAVYGKGNTKSTVRLKEGIDADLRVVPATSFGAALNYFTGSKDHNIALRKIALENGLKLNEYGLFHGTKQIAGATEEDVYRALGLHYIEPELRENTGEIEAGGKTRLPKLIGYSDLKGDLQLQTNWTDGSHSIEAMALAAKKAGLEYILITDHTKSLAMTGGLDEKKLKKQGEEIGKINRKLDGITVLKGAEVNIMKDGSLDIDDRALKELDIVGASIHSNFNMPRADITKRTLAAMENPNVDILFHPTGRILNKRKPFDIDIEQIINVAKSTGTVLEINSLQRLDLKDEHIRMAIKAGVKLCIDSDAHTPSHFSALQVGIAQARRGWAEKKDIINAWPLEKMKKMLK
ncbi:MAG: DNA polymerase/3'-5' exonuclease PolX [Candidatus Aenigmarchaeota archaeon]|nr:DNA polymerase/3'-5' exonuclease PolX [Candidatus Aenigmarchaeota archaeon]